jgi:hypothetical protein
VVLIGHSAERCRALGPWALIGIGLQAHIVSLLEFALSPPIKQQTRSNPLPRLRCADQEVFQNVVGIRSAQLRGHRSLKASQALLHHVNPTNAETSPHIVSEISLIYVEAGDGV